MSSATIYRLSGIGLLIGGGLAAIGAVVQAFLSEEYLSPLWIPIAAIIFIGTLLVQISLPALYIKQMKRAGVLGLIGFILLFCGFAQFGIGFRFFDIVILPWFGKSADLNPPPGFILYSLSGELLLLAGAVLFAIATFRANVIAKGPVILLLVGLVINRLGGHVPHLQDIGGILFYLAFAWFGLALLSSFGQEVEQVRAPASPGTEVHA